MRSRPARRERYPSEGPQAAYATPVATCQSHQSPDELPNLGRRYTAQPEFGQLDLANMDTSVPLPAGPGGSFTRHTFPDASSWNGTPPVRRNLRIFREIALFKRSRGDLNSRIEGLEACQEGSPSFRWEGTSRHGCASKAAAAIHRARFPWNRLPGHTRQPCLRCDATTCGDRAHLNPQSRCPRGEPPIQDRRASQIPMFRRPP